MVDARHQDAGQPPDPDPEQGADQLPLPFEVDEDWELCGVPIVVRRGEARPLVERFVQAQHYASEMWRALAEGELAGQVLTLAPSVNEQGNPCVHIEFTPDGAQALLRALIRGAAPGVSWVWRDHAA